MAGINNASEQIKGFWGSRTGQQKLFLVGGQAPQCC